MKPIIAFVLILTGISTLLADVKLPAIFGDHMVLQQNTKLPVWGWAEPGEKITVAFGKQTAETVTGSDGKWRVDLPAVPAGTPAGALVVSGKNTITINDVLIGDVWLCSGQSNMEWRLKDAHNAKEEIPKANDPQLRIFNVKIVQALSPQEDVAGSWEVCSPSAVPNFTAIGYFFGKNLRTALNRPIGLIESACGGTSVQAWTSLSALEANPALSDYAKRFKVFAANFPNGQADFLAQRENTKKWQEQINADPAYQAAMKEWNRAVAEARTAGNPAPAMPTPPIPAPPKVSFGGDTATVWFNGMLAPLIPYALKGAIWFQGEGNTGNPQASLDYRILLPTLIADWRARWGQGDFPFLFGQLCNRNTLAQTPVATSLWALLRESQLQTLAVPQTGMAVSLDLDPTGNVHFTNKADVGARLALAARHVAYGENLAYTGPIYDSMKVEGDKIRVSFKSDSLGGGLTRGAPPWLDPKATPPSTTELQGFAIAGEDRKWQWADAKIDGDTVILSSPQVPNPVAVRYAWADNPPNNFYNQAALPAAPFRTDDWNPPAAPEK